MIMQPRSQFDDTHLASFDREIEWVNEYLTDSVSPEKMVLMNRLLGPSATVAEMLVVRGLIETMGTQNLLTYMDGFKAVYNKEATADGILRYVKEMI